MQQKTQPKDRIAVLTVFYRKLSAVIGMASFMLGMLAVPTFAGTCLEQVRQLAHEHNLSIDPPNYRPGDPMREVKPRDPGKNGDIIEPKEPRDPAVIAPPDGDRYRMPTLPEVGKPKADRAENESKTLSPSEVSILETLLIAARNDAQRGEEKKCFEKLEKAQKRANGEN